MQMTKDTLRVRRSIDRLTQSVNDKLLRNLSFSSRQKDLELELRQKYNLIEFV